MKKIIAILTLSLIALQAESFTITDRVRVSQSEPAYQNITKRIPYQECWDEQIPVRHGGSGGNNQNVIGTIIGGAGGGVLGHQIGGGTGKTAATIGGAIIGSLLGGKYIGDGSQNRSEDPYTTYETKRRCNTKYSEQKESKFIGYKNIAHYKGETIIKISQRKLRYIPVTVTVSY